MKDNKGHVSHIKAICIRLGIVKVIKNAYKKCRDVDEDLLLSITLFYRNIPTTFPHLDIPTTLIFPILIFPS